MSIYRVVLTGGPCAGKTTSMNKITERLEALGFSVYRVPEAATIMFAGGVKRSHLSSNFSTVGFQELLMKTQMSLEKTFYKLAKQLNTDAVLLCDRGLMDAKSFVTNDIWQAVLDSNQWSEVGLRDLHYDAVIHLVTAANGAEQYYNTDNNKTRIETPEEARIIDDKLKMAWTGHPHFRVVDNSTDFDTKVNRCVSEICRVVGVPEPLEIERKFLVTSYNELPKSAKTFDIEQTYCIKYDESIVRYRKRGADGSFVYTRTIKKDIEPGIRVEIEDKLSSKEYIAELECESIKERHTLKKRRTCFLYKNQYFELDHFLNPRDGLVLLELELQDINQDYELPSFIQIEKDVTKDKNYSNMSIARGDLIE